MMEHLTPSIFNFMLTRH